MIQSETPSLPKTKTTKSEPKQSLIRADLKPCLACFIYCIKKTCFNKSESKRVIQAKPGLRSAIIRLCLGSDFVVLVLGRLGVSDWSMKTLLI